MNRFLSVCAVCMLLASSTAWAGFINFDVDAYGIPISAPSLAINTVHLSELYAPLGVHFSGPRPTDGGAIFNVGANFGIDPRSGLNFLGFNREAVFADGGLEADPETITFDSPMAEVALYVAYGRQSKTYGLAAYDGNGTLLDTDTLTTLTWGRLAVSSPTGITRVVLEQLSGVAFVVDDLTFTPVPEPSSLLALLTGFGGLGGVAWKRRR